MIYLDNAATTRIRDEVLDEMLPFLKDEYGNPSALYSAGREARRAVAVSYTHLTATEGISGALGGGTEEDATGLQNATGAELREKVKSLENQVREMEEQQAENERLRNLLSMKNELGAYETRCV